MEEVVSYDELDMWRDDLEMQHMIWQLKINAGEADVSTGDQYPYRVAFYPLKGELEDHQKAELVWARRLFFDGHAGSTGDQSFTQGTIDVNARMAGIEDNTRIDDVGTTVNHDPGDDGLADASNNVSREFPARYNSIDRVQCRVRSPKNDSSAGYATPGESVAFGTGPIINYREQGDSDYGPIFDPSGDFIGISGNINVDYAGTADIAGKYAVQVAWDVWETEKAEFADLKKVN